MDEITMNAMQLLTSYGALGICCLYFMVKDWTRSKDKKALEVIERNTEVIKDFTVALNVLTVQGK